MDYKLGTLRSRAERRDARGGHRTGDACVLGITATMNPVSASRQLPGATNAMPDAQSEVAPESERERERGGVP